MATTKVFYSGSEKLSELDRLYHLLDKAEDRGDMRRADQLAQKINELLAKTKTSN